MGNTKDEPYIVVDASPLISALKIGRFDIFAVLRALPICTEYTRALCRRAALPGEVDELLSRRVMREITISDPAQHSRICDLVDGGLSDAEASSIVLAGDLNVPVVMDDRHAIKIAKKLKICVLTSTDVVLANIRCRALTIDEADRLITDWRAVKEVPITVRSLRDLGPGDGDYQHRGLSQATALTADSRRRRGPW